MPLGRWAGWALAHTEFGSLVNPIPTGGGGDYANHITAFPFVFENLTAASLYLVAFIHFKFCVINIKGTVEFLMFENSATLG